MAIVCVFVKEMGTEKKQIFTEIWKMCCRNSLGPYTFSWEGEKS